jgi:hypothetical protein
MSAVTLAYKISPIFRGSQPDNLCEEHVPYPRDPEQSRMAPPPQPLVPAEQRHDLVPLRPLLEPEGEGHTKGVRRPPLRRTVTAKGDNNLQEDITLGTPRTHRESR